MVAVLYPEFRKGSVAADPKAFVNAANYAAMRTLLGLGTADSPTFAGVTATGAISAGNVGVGVATAAEKLHTHAANANNGLLMTRFISGANYGGSAVYHNFSSSIDGLAFGVSGDGGSGSANYTIPSDSSRIKMLIRHNGNTLIGTTTDDAINRVQVAGNLTLRNGTTGTKLSAHKTYTSTTSHEMLEIDAATDASNFDLAILSGSLGGSPRGLRIGSKYAGAATLTPWLSFAPTTGDAMFGVPISADKALAGYPYTALDVKYGTYQVIKASVVSGVGSVWESSPVFGALNIRNDVLNFQDSAGTTLIRARLVSSVPAVSIGGGGFNATAYLHLAAGTATAGTAPLKLNAGTNLTTPENGAIEYDGTNLYFTDGTGTRRTLAVV